MPSATKPILATFLAVALFSSTFLGVAYADTPKGGGFSGNTSGTVGGGFTGPGPAITTVKDARGMWDDSWVVLRGRITQALGDEHYLFVDGTGQIEVEIDHDKWHGQQIGPNDTVEIQGEVDKDFTNTKIDVKRVLLLKK